MSASPEVMKALQGGGGPDAGAPPGAAPMMAPQKAEGKQAGAAVQVLMAIKVLEQSMSAFSSTDEKGKAIIKAIASLGKAFGKQESESEELLPAENKIIQQALQGPGAGAPPGPPPGGPPQGAPQGAPPPPPPG